MLSEACTGTGDVLTAEGAAACWAAAPKLCGPTAVGTLTTSKMKKELLKTPLRTDVIYTMAFYSQYPCFDTFLLRNVAGMAPKPIADVIAGGHIRFFVEAWCGAPPPCHLSPTRTHAHTHTPLPAPLQQRSAAVLVCVKEISCVCHPFDHARSVQAAGWSQTQRSAQSEENAEEKQSGEILVRPLPALLFVCGGLVSLRAGVFAATVLRCSLSVTLHRAVLIGRD